MSTIINQGHQKRRSLIRIVEQEMTKMPHPAGIRSPLRT